VCACVRGRENITLCDSCEVFMYILVHTYIHELHVCVCVCGIFVCSCVCVCVRGETTIALRDTRGEVGEGAGVEYHFQKFNEPYAPS